MIIEEDIYLEHFGIKGMQWGVRKSKTSSSKGTKGKINTKKKVAIGVGVGITIAAGSAFVANRSRANKAKTLANIVRSNDARNNISVGRQHAGMVFRSNGYAYPANTIFRGLSDM